MPGRGGPPRRGRPGGLGRQHHLRRHQRLRRAEVRRHERGGHLHRRAQGPRPEVGSRYRTAARRFPAHPPGREGRARQRRRRGRVGHADPPVPGESGVGPAHRGQAGAEPREHLLYHQGAGQRPEGGADHLHPRGRDLPRLRRLDAAPLSPMPRPWPSPH